MAVRIVRQCQRRGETAGFAISARPFDSHAPFLDRYSAYTDPRVSRPPIRVRLTTLLGKYFGHPGDVQRGGASYRAHALQLGVGSGSPMPVVYKTPSHSTASHSRAAFAPAPAHAGMRATHCLIDRACPVHRDTADDADSRASVFGHDDGFPYDILEVDQGMQAPSNERFAAFHAVLPRVKRVAIYRLRDGTIHAVRAECFGVYLIDCDVKEHLVLCFKNASNATYAALRIAQVYRLGMEFGNFREPRACGDSMPLLDRLGETSGQE